MTKSDEDEIRDIELKFNEAWGRHDLDGMIELLVDDAQFGTSTAHGPPVARASGT